MNRPDPIYQFEIRVTAESLDANRHVNNVEYVRWMQDAATRHSDSAGCTRETIAAGATWVARSHQIEYLKPAFEGDTIVIQTWVADMRKVRSLRRYRFLRASDQAVLAEGQTDWVLVDVKSGRPRSIPPSISSVFQLLPDQHPG